MTHSTARAPAAVIWLLYNPARVLKGIELIKQIALSDRLDRLVVVWNGQGAVPTEAAGIQLKKARVEVVRGSNHGREFGGYQDGLDHLARSANGGIYFLNDTAGVHNYLPSYFVGALTSAARRLSNREGVCVGHTDRALHVLEIAGLTGDSWVRSNLFYLDSIALQALDWKIYSPEINELIPGEGPEHFYADELNPQMRARLDHWLFQPGRGSWYEAAPLTAENANFMAGKARSILQEYFFSMRVAHAGIMQSRTDMSSLKLFWLKLINRLGRESGRLK